MSLYSVRRSYATVNLIKRKVSKFAPKICKMVKIFPPLLVEVKYIIKWAKFSLID